MFFGDWLQRREMLSPNKVALIGAIDQDESLTYRQWNQPEATAESLVNGWLYTGDLAKMDQDGCYSIVGRLKNMIKSGGEIFYPAEIEDVMHSHQAIAEAALIPAPDPKWGEASRAIVVLKPGIILSEQEFIQWLRDRMAHFKVPKSVVYVEELPKTAANKVDKECWSANMEG